MDKVFFSNSGAEANECAIKAARKYAAEHKGPEYHTIITLKNSFHGRTITTLAATGQDVFHHDFLPLTEGFVYAEPNDLADLARLIAENKCAAVMMEVVQGEGGVMPLDEAYVKGAAKLCQENDLLLICDEVQIGNGRSGKLYGYMHYGVQPDIVSTAKGLAGGLPLGATLLGEKVQDVLSAGTHGSTFGGNPVCCAGARRGYRMRFCRYSVNSKYPLPENFCIKHPAYTYDAASNMHHLAGYYQLNAYDKDQAAWVIPIPNATIEFNRGSLTNLVRPTRDMIKQ